MTDIQKLAIRLDSAYSRKPPRTTDSPQKLLEYSAARMEELRKGLAELDNPSTEGRSTRIQNYLRKVQRGRADRLLNRFASLVQSLDPPAPRFPVTLRDLLGEFESLGEEFEGGVETKWETSKSAYLRSDDYRSSCTPKIELAVDTDDIELEHVNLGPFRIVLDVDSLLKGLESGRDDDLGVGCFFVKALSPCPSNLDYVHPHVNRGAVCIGDGAAPLRTALRQGRLTDAFLIVKTVLSTYNPGSAYQRLDEWDGSATRCDRCDSTVGDDGSACATCGVDLCDDCVLCCSDDGCKSPVCSSCRRECRVCGEGFCRSCTQVLYSPDRPRIASQSRVCAACRRACPGCGETKAVDDFGDLQESPLCLWCAEAKSNQPQDEEDKDHDNATADNADPCDPDDGLGHSQLVALAQAATEVEPESAAGDGPWGGSALVHSGVEV